MPFKSWRGSLATHGLAFLVGAGLAWSAFPLWRQAIMTWHQGEYGALVEQCDTAMRDHFQAKRAATIDPNSSADASLRSAEIGLIVCQDYDLYQKRLMQWGLREEDLAQMRLKAIEARATDLEDVIDTHEIRF